MSRNLQVFRATNHYGGVCYFGVASAAKAWAKGGEVETINVREAVELRVVNLPSTQADEIERLQAENARMFDALTWAMGANGEFPRQSTMEGPHYWRGELAERAGIFWNGERYLHRPTNQAVSGRCTKD